MIYIQDNKKGVLMDKKKVTDTEELLREYKEQTHVDNEHSFPYYVYGDYSDHSDCGC